MRHTHTSRRRCSTLLALACVAVTASALTPLSPLAAGNAAAAPSPATTTSAAAAPRKPVPLPAVPPPAGLDEATRKATDLQQQMEDLKAESAALDERIRQTNERIDLQATVLEQARQDARAAQAQFDERIIGIYKAGRVTTLELFLSARSFAEILDRGVFLYSMLDRDQAALEIATKLSAEAAYEAGLLQDLRDRDAALRDVKQARVDALRVAIEQQRSIVATLSAQQRAYVASKARFDTGQRARWKETSYFGASPRRVGAFVDPYTDRTYLVDAGEPTRFTTTGRISTELCSWYGNAGNGSVTASGRAFNENEFTCATLLRDPDDPLGRRLLPFGTRLALTRGDRRIVVAVTDRGPYAGERTIDLSRAAADALGFDGVATVQVEIVKVR